MTSSHLFTSGERTSGIVVDGLDSRFEADDQCALTFEGMMSKLGPYHVAPFKRRQGELAAEDLLAFPSEAKAFRQGKAMLGRVDGLVFFKIECSEDGDIWTEIETLATVGDVPPEAEEAA